MKIRVAVVVLLTCVTAAAQAPPQQIFFTRVFPVPTELGLFIANADGSDEHPLPGTADVDYDPAWSPDGDWIAFTREVNAQQTPGIHGKQGTYIMRADGTDTRRIAAEPRGGHNVDWGR